MPKRFGLGSSGTGAGIVLALTLDASAQQPVEHPKGQSVAAHQSESSQPTGRLGDPSSSGKSQLTRNASQFDADWTDEQRRIQRWSLWISIAQFAAGLGGLVGLALTVLYARGAWREAQKSALEAVKANQNFERSLEDGRADSAAQSERFERQLDVAKSAADAAHMQATILINAERAYISPFGTLLDNEGALTVKLFNSGRTSAVITSYVLLPFMDLPGSPEFLTPGTIVQMVDYVVGERDEFWLPALTLLGPVRDAKHLLGYVEYRDVFGNMHETRFRFDRERGWKASGGAPWARAT